MAYIVSIKNLKKAINPLKTYEIKSSEIKKAIDNLDIFPISGGNQKTNMVRNIAYKVLNPTDLPVTLDVGDIESGNIPENIISEGAEELIAAIYLEKETIAVNFKGNLATVKTFVGQSLENLTELDTQDKPVLAVDWTRGFNVEEHWDDKEYIFTRLNMNAVKLMEKIDKTLWKDEAFIIDFLDKKKMGRDDMQSLVDHVSKKTLLSDLFFSELKTHPVAFYKLWKDFYYDNIYREPDQEMIRHQMQSMHDVFYQRQRGNSYNDNNNWGLPPMPLGFTQRDDLDIDDFEHELQMEETLLAEEKFYRQMEESLFPKKSASELHIKQLIDKEILNNPEFLREIMLNNENGDGILRHVSPMLLTNHEIFDTFWGEENYRKNGNWYIHTLPAQGFKDEYIIKGLFERASFSDLESKEAFHGKWLKDTRKLEKFIAVSNTSFVALFKDLPKVQQNNAQIVEAFMQRHPKVYTQLPEEFKEKTEYILHYISDSDADLGYVPAKTVFSLDLEDEAQRKNIMTILQADTKGVFARKDNFPESWLADKEVVMSYKHVLAHHSIAENIWDELVKENMSGLFRMYPSIYKAMPVKYSATPEIALAYIGAMKTLNQNEIVTQGHIPATLWGSKSFCLKAIEKLGEKVVNSIPQQFFKEQQFLLDVTEMVSSGKVSIQIFNNVPSINQFFAESGSTRQEYHRNLKNYFSHANITNSLGRMLPQEDEEDNTPQIKI